MQLGAVMSGKTFEAEYLPISKKDEYLIHFTKSPETILRILNHGFYYICNDTLINEKIFRPLNQEIKDIEKGMVCFTCSALDETEGIRSRFGNFGIVMKYDWALDQGGRKVAYIPEDGPVFQALTTIVKESVPNLSYLSGMDEESRKFAEKFILEDSSLPDIFTNPLYSIVREMAQWFEIDHHSSEKEFRIRSPKTLGGMASFDGATQVRMIDGMKFLNPESYCLKFRPENIGFLCCAEDHIGQLREQISGTTFEQIEVKICS